MVAIGEFATEPGPFLAPNRELQFSLVEINGPVCHSPFAASIFSMLAGSCNFAINGFDQVMIMSSGLQQGRQTIVDIIISEMGIKRS